jgi:hypothetical protein
MSQEQNIQDISSDDGAGQPSSRQPLHQRIARIFASQFLDCLLCELAMAS